MVSTRTQTRAISVAKYDYLTLKAKGEKPRVTKRPSKQKEPGPDRNKRRQRSGSVDERSVESIWSEPEPMPVTTDSNFFWPEVVLGEEPQGGLSNLERADLRVRQWESILKEHEENFPEAAAPCRAMLLQAKKDREVLRLDPANAIKWDREKRSRAVQERIQILKEALSTAQHEPEKENIRGAITAYESGEIQYCKEYTLIWNGKVVDQAPDYASFTEDRLERLDRYAEKYGPHWLWWESPLWLEPSQRVKAAGCQIIDRVSAQHGFGHFYINQGFWKRSGWVARMPQLQTPNYGPSPDSRNFIEVNSETFCQLEGPKLIIQCLLDSGASFPSLYESDFKALGIQKAWYGAQSVVVVSTANGAVPRRVFEVHVEIAGNPGTPIIDPNNPVNPQYSRYVGGVSPVTMDEHEPIPDENGAVGNNRLSGIMPFVAPYVSITPSRNTILMGEDRNDVLGGHKMPPTRKWMVGLDQDPRSRAHWPAFGDPLIRFKHRNGLLVDEDLAPGVSKMTVNGGLWNETSHINDPRGKYQNQAVEDPSVVAIKQHSKTANPPGGQMP